jgi:hypothetical protein
MAVVYVKFLHNENGVTYTKQKVCTILDEDHHGNVTVKIYNDDIKDYELMVLREGQYSNKPYLMDFD